MDDEIINVIDGKAEITKKLEYLDETKEMIRQAIIKMGQQVGTAITFREYPEYIKKIKTGDVLLYSSYSSLAKVTDVNDGQIALVYNAKSKHLDGIYTYSESMWKRIDTQYTLEKESQLLPGISAMGKTGNITGDNTFYNNYFDYKGMLKNLYNVTSMDGGQEFYLLNKLQGKSYAPVKIVEDILFNIHTSTIDPILVKESTKMIKSDVKLTPSSSPINERYGAGKDYIWFYKMYENNMRFIYYKDNDEQLATFVECAHTGTIHQTDFLFKYNGSIYLARPNTNSVEILIYDRENNTFTITNTYTVSDDAYILEFNESSLYIINYTQTIGEMQVYSISMMANTMSDVLKKLQSYLFPNSPAYTKYIVDDKVYLVNCENQPTNNSAYYGGQNGFYTTQIFTISSVVVNDIVESRLDYNGFETESPVEELFLYETITEKNSGNIDVINAVAKVDGVYKLYIQSPESTPPQVVSTTYNFKFSRNLDTSFGLPARHPIYGDVVFEKPNKDYDYISYRTNQRITFSKETLNATIINMTSDYQIMYFQDYYVVNNYTDAEYNLVKVAFYKEIPINDASVGYVLIDGQATKLDETTGMTQNVYYNLAPASISEDDYLATLKLSYDILGVEG